MLNKITGPGTQLSESHTTETLSPWWRRISLLTMALGFAVLILLTVKVYHEAPPIPDKVTGPDGSVLFTGDDIPGDLVFIVFGVAPIAIAVGRAYFGVGRRADCGCGM